MREFNIPGKYKVCEQEFREATRAWIEKQNKGYTRTEAGIVKDAKPLRHPKGVEHKRHTLEYLWSDAIWCQDCTLDPLCEFFELDFDDGEYQEIMDNQGCDGVADWANQIFNDEFKAVLPNLAHVLEG